MWLPRRSKKTMTSTPMMTSSPPTQRGDRDCDIPSFAFFVDPGPQDETRQQRSQRTVGSCKTRLIYLQRFGTRTFCSAAAATTMASHLNQYHNNNSNNSNQQHAVGIGGEGGGMTMPPAVAVTTAATTTGPMIDEDAVAAADKEMEERANRAKELLSQRYKGLRVQQVRTTVLY